VNRSGTVELARSRLVRVRIPDRLCAGSHRFALGCITGMAVSVSLPPVASIYRLATVFAVGPRDPAESAACGARRCVRR
jgi:hypothetical protein